VTLVVPPPDQSSSPRSTSPRSTPSQTNQQAPTIPPAQCRVSPSLNGSVPDEQHCAITSDGPSQSSDAASVSSTKDDFAKASLCGGSTGGVSDPINPRANLPKLERAEPVALKRTTPSSEPAVDPAKANVHPNETKVHVKPTLPQPQLERAEPAALKRTTLIAEPPVDSAKSIVYPSVTKGHVKPTLPQPRFVRDVVKPVAFNSPQLRPPSNSSSPFRAQSTAVVGSVSRKTAATEVAGPSEHISARAKWKAASMKVDAAHRAGPVCVCCSKNAYPMESVQADGDVYHKGCFRCDECNKVRIVPEPLISRRPCSTVLYATLTSRHLTLLSIDVEPRIVRRTRRQAFL
jgi:hypothetical protein